MLVRVFILLCCVSCFGETLRLSLADAERIATENNKLLLDLQEQIARAHSYKQERLSKWLPRLRMAYYMYDTTIENPLSASKSNFLTQIHLTQEIFSADTYYGLILADTGVQLVEDLYNSAANDVLYGVRTQYYKILTDYHLIDAAQEHVTLLQQLAQQMEDRYTIGTSIEYNVNQSLVAVSNAMQHYYQRIRALKDDIDSLVNMLGYQPGSCEIAIAERDIPLSAILPLRQRIETTEKLFTGNTKRGALYTPLFPEEERSIMASLFSRPEVVAYSNAAIAHNPVIRTIETELTIAQQEVRAAYGAYLPKVTANANFGGIPDPFEFYPSGRFNNQNFDTGVGLNFSWTIFDSFGRESKVSQAKYKRNATGFKLEKEKQNIVQDVRAQIHSLEEAIASFVTARSNNALALQTLEQAKEQLEVGYIDIFDYQISVNGLIQARTAEVSSQFDVIKAYFGLIHATGGYEEDGSNKE